MGPTRHALNHDPNVVPMIDVLLVLLIIFMLANLFGQHKLEVQLPEQSPAAADASTPIVLSVEPGPEYAINGTAVPTHRLDSALRAVYLGRPDKVLYVKGARALRYQDMFTVFDVARGAGVDATGIVFPP